MATLREHNPQHFAKYADDSDNRVPSRLICMVCTAAEDMLHGLQLESPGGTPVLEAIAFVGNIRSVPCNKISCLSRIFNRPAAPSTFEYPLFHPTCFGEKV